MLKKATATAIALVSVTSCSFASGEQGTITATSLNVRSGPSTNNSIIGKLNKGTVIDILGKSGDWYKTKFNGKEGWVSSKYVKLTTVENSSGDLNNTTTTKKAKTTATTLNMRNGAGTVYSIIKKLPKGTEIEVISVSGDWVKMKHDGRLGYVHKNYIEYITTNTPSNPTVNLDNLTVLSTKEVINTNNLNVRSGPSTKYNKIGNLVKGQKVYVVGEENGWSKIKYGNTIGYCSNDYLKIVSDSNTSSSNSNNQVIGTKSVTTKVNVRSGASTSYSILGVLNYNDTVEVYSEENGWTKIKYANSVGYVSSEYLSGFINIGDINSDATVEEGVITYNKLNYTLSSHISKQMDRVAIGGNVISSSKPRTVGSSVKSGGFVPAELDDIEYFLNPNNFVNSSKGMKQFLLLNSYKEGITADELNTYLNALPKNDGKGGNVFYNQGQTFIDSAKKNNIDLAYLVAHAMWETGYGGSTLAKGQTISSYKGEALEKPITVYNFYGIGAIDKSANVSGAEASYSNGWTSIEKTIEGSAEWLSKNYIHSTKYNQNTIYKMKFNYDYTWHQYATDVNWANGISGIMNTISNMYDNKSLLVYEVPSYSN